MDKSINDILCKLKILSKLQSGQKLMIEDLNIQIMECDKNNWDRIVKWWLGETRYSTLDKLQSLYYEIVDLANQMMKNSRDYQISLKRLEKEINSSLRGLDNLILTYQNDHSIVSKIETLIENFKIIKSKIKSNTLPDPPNQDEFSDSS